MHKKLASDLTSLAHSILQMKNKEDVNALKDKAYALYEKLTVLAYVEEYINTTPQAEVTKEELLTQIEKIEIDREENSRLVALKVEENSVEKEEITEPIVDVKEEEIVSTIIDQSVEKETDTEKKEEVLESIEESTVEKTEQIVEEELESIVEDNLEEKYEKEEDVTENVEEVFAEKLEEPIKQIVEEKVDNITEESGNEAVEEQKNVIDNTIEEVIEEKKKVEEIEEQPFEELENLLFGEKDVKNDADFIEELKAPTLEEELKDTLPVDVMANLFQKVEPKKTVNDHLQNTIQIDLNDRIAFVKHLFNGNQTDFNRVISQLNTFKTEKEAKGFINRMIKPDYNWSDKEEYENRLLEIIERRFL